MADRILIFGNGWLGNRLAKELHGDITEADITSCSAISGALSHYGPSVVINAAGKTGRPNIDGCEKDPAGTLLANVAGPIHLAEECVRRGIFMVHIGSGCVYNDSKSGYTEEDPPNFFGSVYSRSKALAEGALKNLPVLQLRIRMPFDGVPHQRNLITKLLKYKRIISVPNSVTCIDDFVVAAECLIAGRKTGIWNVVNPGTITHDRILSLYQAMVDLKHEFEIMPLAELSKVTQAERSNCVLSTEKLEKEGIRLRPVLEAIVDALKQYRDRL